MNRFASLLDRLSYEPRRNARLSLLADYFRTTPDPERGYALAALTDGLTFPQAKAGLLRKLIADKTDPVLFALSYAYVGDLAETVALLWPVQDLSTDDSSTISLTSVVETLAEGNKAVLPTQVSEWLNALDLHGRWALLKLITGGLRVGISARLAKTAVAQFGNKEPDAIEQIWHGLTPPYTALFDWLEGKGPKPETDDPAPFRPVMLAHALEEADFGKLDPRDFLAEWKWDGIRVQATSGADKNGQQIVRLYSRTGDDLTRAFPDLLSAIPADSCCDGELLILRDGHVQPFNVLQQRLNRTLVSAKLLADFPAHIRLYDLLVDRTVECRALPFSQRRERLETRFKQMHSARISLSPLIPFDTWDGLAQERADPSKANADASVIEGCMIKRRDSPYLAGRPKGAWFKWKNDPRRIDAVLMYAQQGHGKRASFYSDFTFGVWRSVAGKNELVPVGKAYFGFTDEELVQLDRFVRKHTVDRHGPVRVVTANAEVGLVLEIAFEGLNRSTRHKSGVAMRFPRIARIRWDKPSRDADRLESLEKLLQS